LRGLFSVVQRLCRADHMDGLPNFYFVPHVLQQAALVRCPVRPRLISSGVNTAPSAVTVECLVPGYSVTQETQSMAQARFHKIFTAEDPDAFYITENARDVRLPLRPLSTERTGWRAVLKRKWV
jgi:hypothetical protein